MLIVPIRAPAVGAIHTTARQLTPLLSTLAVLGTLAATTPMVLRSGDGPQRHVSVRGAEVLTFGYGPYRHMPADVAVQGFAQDVVTLAVAVPALIVTLLWARGGSRQGHLALSGVTAYFFVQYFMYLGMATYNELFLLWAGLVLVSFQALSRLLLAVPIATFAAPQATLQRRRFVGGVLVANGLLISLLWLSVILPAMAPERYPVDLGHLTTMFVQGFDLALFLPPSIAAGLAYWRGRGHGNLLAPIYSVFLSLQMLALLAKILWMTAAGESTGPALVLIGLLLGCAIAAAALALRGEAPTSVA